MNNYGQVTVEELTLRKAQFPVGCRVKLISMEDPYAPKGGSLGTVTNIDPFGDLEVDWDCGSKLKVIYGVDNVVRL